MKNIFLYLSLLILRFSYTNAQSIYYLDKKKDNTEKLLKAIQEETVDSIKALKSYEIAARFVVRQDLDNYNKYIAQGDLFSKNSRFGITLLCGETIAPNLLPSGLESK